MQVLSLFDGMSCGQIALNRVNIAYDKYYAAEINSAAIKVTQFNYPQTVQLGDITQVKAANHVGIDLLLGGSPCQGFSSAGKKLNFNDPRSKLFFDFVRIKNRVKPTYFIFENVVMRPEWVNIINKFIGCTPIFIDSALVSAARRRRLYWTNIPNIHMPVDRNITFDDINSNSSDWIDPTIINKIRAWKAGSRPVENATLIGSKSKLRTLTARGYNQYHSGMVLITDGSNYRYLTNEEAEQAHTVPIGYTSICNDKERSHMIGNGWTVDVIAHLLSHI